MKSLYNTILESDKIDGHIHLFDHSGIINQSLIDTSKRCVCFADISFKYIDKYKKSILKVLKYEDCNSYLDKSFINIDMPPMMEQIIVSKDNKLISLYESNGKKYKTFFNKNEDVCIVDIDQPGT